MTKKFALPLLFIIVFGASFFALLASWTNAMVCADIGHSCRLGSIDESLLLLLGAPVSIIPHELLLRAFGTTSIFPLLLLSSIIWGILAVIAALLVLYLKGEYRFH